MPILPINAQRAPKAGGASKGGVLGGLAAILAAPFTGGASLAALPAAMGAGQAVGGLVDKGQAGSSGPPVQPSNAMSRRLESQAPRASDPGHSAILEDSLKALHESNDRAMQDQFGEPLFKALTMSMSKDKGGRIV